MCLVEHQRQVPSQWTLITHLEGPPCSCTARRPLRPTAWTLAAALPRVRVCWYAAIRSRMILGSISVSLPTMASTDLTGQQANLRMDDKQ